MKLVEKIFLTAVILVVSFSFLAIPQASGQEGYEFEIPLPKVGLPEVGGVSPGSSPASYIRYLFVFGLGIAGILAFAMIVIAGIKYATAGGNESQIRDARDQISQAILGLLLLMASYLILKTINPALVNLSALEIPAPIVSPYPSPAAGCPIITSWTGQEPLGVSWENTDPDLKPAADAFVQKVSSYRVGTQRGEAIITSAWRPAEYQTHLRSAWEAWKLVVKGESLTQSCLGNNLQPPPAGACDALAGQAQQEVEQIHHLVTSGAACGGQSDHNNGTAVDIDWSGIPTSLVEQYANDAGLCHPYAFDRPHFVLKKAHPRCSDKY